MSSGPLDRMFGTLCIFPADTKIPLHVVLRYWFEVGSVVPNIAKRLLAAMVDDGLLTIVGDMKYHVPPQTALAPGPPAPGKSAVRSELRQVGTVGDLVTFYQTKLNAYTVEQEKYEKSAQPRMAGDDDGVKFSSDDVDEKPRRGGRTRQQQKQVAAAAAKREGKQNGANLQEFAGVGDVARQGLVSLLTGYDEEEDDAKVSVVLNLAQHAQSHALLKDDAALWFGAAERKGRAMGELPPRNPKEVLALRRGEVFDANARAQQRLSKDGRMRKNMSVTERVEALLAGSMHALQDWEEVVEAEQGFAKLSLAVTKARASRRRYSFAPPDLSGVTGSLAREVVTHKQATGHHEMDNVAVRSKGAALQRLHASLIDAWGRLLPEDSGGAPDGDAAAATYKCMFHKGPDDGWFYEHVPYHLAAATLPEPHSPEYYIARALILHTTTHDDFGLVATVFPYPSRKKVKQKSPPGVEVRVEQPPMALDESMGESVGQSLPGTRPPTPPAASAGRPDEVHLSLQETYSATIVADALKQIHEHPLVECLATQDLEPKIIALALLAPEVRVRVSYTAIIKQCKGNYHVHLLVSQICAALAEGQAAWYRGTWLEPSANYLIRMRKKELGGTDIGADAAVPKSEEVLGTLLEIIPLGFHKFTAAPSVELLYALMQFCETHPSLALRTRCGALLRSCVCEELAVILVSKLQDAATADPKQIRMVWPDGDSVLDDCQVGTVSGGVGAGAIAVFAAFPILSDVAGELARVEADLHIVLDEEDEDAQLARQLQTYSQVSDALVDKWFIPDEPPNALAEVEEAAARADARKSIAPDDDEKRRTSFAAASRRASRVDNRRMSRRMSRAAMAVLQQKALKKSSVASLGLEKDARDDPQTEFGERKVQRSRKLSTPLIDSFQTCNMRLIDFINRQDLWRFEAFCAVQKVAEKPGGRAARVICNCLVKLWHRYRVEEYGCLTADPPRAFDGEAFNWCEEAGDVLHLIRDCLDYSDSEGLRACLRAVPQQLFLDRGLIAALLLIGFKHEAEAVRSELAARFVHVPPRHWSWMAAQLGLALKRFAYTPFMVSQVLSSCPSIPADPPENLMELVLTEVKTGCQDCRRLLRRSPSYPVTSAMAAALGQNWVIDGLPPLGTDTADALITGLTSDMTYLSHHEVRASCRQGDNRVGASLARLLSQTSDLEHSVLIIQALPSFKVLGSSVIRTLFNCARSDHPVAPQLQQLLCFGKVTSSAGASGGASAADAVDDLASVENDSVRVPIVNDLVAESLEEILVGGGIEHVAQGEMFDVENPTALQGILWCAPTTFLFSFRQHACMETLLLLTWCCSDYDCRAAAQELFERCTGGWATLIAHLSPIMIAHADQDHVGEAAAGEGDDAIPQVAERHSPTASDSTGYDFVSDEQFVRVIDAMPSDANNVDDRVLDIMIAYAFEHQNEEVMGACRDFIWNCAVPGKLFDKFERMIEAEQQLLHAIELLPRNLARAGESLLVRLLVIGASHHDPVTRETTQALLRLNQTNSASLPGLLHAQLQEQDHDVLGILRCINGASLPPVLLSTVCSLLLHSDKEVADTAYEEVSKVASAKADIVPVLMKCVEVALEPRLVGVPEEVCAALLRNLTLFVKWQLSADLSEGDVTQLLRIAAVLPGREHAALSLQLVRNAKPKHGKVCLKLLIKLYGYAKPDLIARGLPEFPAKQAAVDIGTSPWEYDNLLKAVVSKVLDGTEEWAVDLARRSRVLWPTMTTYVRAGVMCESSITSVRKAALAAAAKTMQSLPGLRAVAVDKAGGTAVDAGKLMDAICLLADGEGEPDVLAALREPARKLVLGDTDL
eukprot:TRINITY_DN3292_c0_g3_i1.p1 TRINITY_DN3292_c0_g3~~TRINITY_DN3292_c0_g3_i1.p1  ORF type:complete len:1824 (+),score=576.60 TRINITY_DN3292_c0_g3_i1:174-5645(+)